MSRMFIEYKDHKDYVARASLRRALCLTATKTPTTCQGKKRSGHRTARHPDPNRGNENYFVIAFEKLMVPISSVFFALSRRNVSTCFFSSFVPKWVYTSACTTTGCSMCWLLVP